MQHTDFITKYPSFRLLCNIAINEGRKLGVTLSDIIYNKPYIDITYTKGVASETNSLDPKGFYVTNKGRCFYALTRLLNLDIHTLNQKQEIKKMTVTKNNMLELLASMQNVVESWDGDETQTETESATTTTNKRTSKKKVTSKKELSSREKCEALADMFKSKNSLKELKAFLNEDFEVKRVSDIDDDDLEELIEVFETEGYTLESNDSDDNDTPKSEEDISIESVKIACQAYTKVNGKDEMKDIFEDYGINSVRGLSKLSTEQLEDLFAAVTDD